MNISLKDSNGQIRDLGDVLDEVASKWDTFSRNEQNQISTAIAGEMCARTYSNIWIINNQNFPISVNPKLIAWEYRDNTILDCAS